jgi:hypothetical protein
LATFFIAAEAMSFAERPRTILASFVPPGFAAPWGFLAFLRSGVDSSA